MLAIQTEDLSKDFKIGFWRPRPYRALDRLSLSVEQGEVFGFLGPNGARSRHFGTSEGQTIFQETSNTAIAAISISGLPTPKTATSLK